MKEPSTRNGGEIVAKTLLTCGETGPETRANDSNPFRPTHITVNFQAQTPIVVLSVTAAADPLILPCDAVGKVTAYDYVRKCRYFLEFAG